MTYQFGTNADMWADGTYGEVRHRIKVGNARILCRISDEAIGDMFEDPAENEIYLDVAMRHFDEITDIWGDRINRGRREPDGSVLIRSP